MASTYLGIDMGYDSLKLALVNGGKLKKAVCVPMQNALIKEGRVVSVESMGELLRNTMKENGIRCQKAAFVLSSETVYVRNVRMPRMNAEQLLVNIPYEFNDYINDEPKNYVFDYAMITRPGEVQRDENGDDTNTMELMAVAVPRNWLEELREIARKAGMKMERAAPIESCYASLIRNHEARNSAGQEEYCLLDLGHHAIRMDMFRSDCHMVTRELEIGLNMLDIAIGESYHVDSHLAHTYLLTNYENCQTREFCMNAYGSIAVELMRALNFYRFSNPDSQLNDIWLCGGGAIIEPLRDAIRSTLDMNIHSADELLPDPPAEEGFRYIQAIGVTMD